MSEHITLLGAEDVQRAAHTMREAADVMTNVHNWSVDRMEQHHRFVDDWLNRFEQTLKEHKTR